MVVWLKQVCGNFVFFYSPMLYCMCIKYMLYTYAVLHGIFL